MTQASSRSLRRAWIYGPLVVVLLLAAGWTAFWFYAAKRAETAISTWIAREAEAGRIYECGSRSVGGFPFRFEVRCDDVRSRVRGFNRPLVMRLGSLLAVAQVYEPDLVIVEVTGPMSVASEDGSINYSFAWRLLQASLRGFPLKLERASLAIDDLTVKDANAASDAALAQARHVELHARLRSGAPDMTFDLAGTADAAVIALAPISGQQVDATIEAVVKGVKDLAPKPFDERVRQWQADGGKLEITKARVAQGEAVAVASGEIGLSPQGRLDGGLRVLVAGLEQIGALIFGQTSQGRAQASLMGGLAMLAGRGEVEGKRAVPLPLRFKDGEVRLGPVSLGQIPPLF